MGFICISSFPNAEVTVSFHDANLNLQSVTWVLNLSDGRGINTKIYRTNINPDIPVVDRDDYTDGSEQVPGAFSVIEMTDEFFGFTYYILPPELRFEHRVIP